MVPPWVQSIPAESTPPDTAIGNGSSNIAGQEPELLPSPQEPIPVAPPRRFRQARVSMSGFARRGNRADLNRGLGNYIRHGYGGSRTASRRFAGTATTAQSLYSALSTSATNPLRTPGGELDPARLVGRSVYDVIDAVVEVVLPIDGTLDAEARRAAISDALSELLSLFPDADLLNLEDHHRETAVERFVAADVFRRIDLDLGRTIREMAPNATTALARLHEIQQYVVQVVAASFRHLKESGKRMAADSITGIVQNALRETFEVFEGYAK